MKREGEWQRRGAPVHLGSLPLFSLPRAKGSPPTHPYINFVNHTRGEKDVMKERQTSREERKKEKEETARKGEKEKNPKITPKNRTENTSATSTQEEKSLSWESSVFVTRVVTCVIVYWLPREVYFLPRLV